MKKRKAKAIVRVHKNREEKNSPRHRRQDGVVLRCWEDSSKHFWHDVEHDVKLWMFFYSLLTSQDLLKERKKMNNFPRPKL